MINPYWIEDRDLKKGEVDYISSAEAQFWKDLLEKYLHPIDENKEEKVCVSRCYYTVRYCTNIATNTKSDKQIGYSTV
jgi:chitin synthase